MSQYAYILVVISLVALFLINKYEKEKLQRLLQEQLLKDESFRATIKEKIQTTENINDVIDYINKGYRLGIMISKEIVEDIRKWKKIRDAFLESFYLFLTAKISTRITIPKDTMVPNGAASSSKIFSENSSRAIANSSKALHSIISLKLGLRFIYFKNDLCSLLISIVPFLSKSFIHGIKLFLRKSDLLQSF